MLVILVQHDGNILDGKHGKKIEGKCSTSPMVKQKGGRTGMLLFVQIQLIQMMCKKIKKETTYWKQYTRVHIPE